MRRVLPIVVVIIAIAVIVGIALGNKNSNNTNSTTPPPSSSNTSTNNPQPSSNSSNNQAQSTDKVSIANMSFSPADITVKKGATVTWTNNDSITHTVTADSGNTFDSGNLEPGKTFSHTFNDTGTFAYHCNIHPNMTGKVTVTE
jgi:plastocyanin